MIPKFNHTYPYKKETERDETHGKEGNVTMEAKIGAIWYRPRNVGSISWKRQGADSTMSLQRDRGPANI